MSEVLSLPLSKQAAAIARNYGDKGAIIITLGEEGIRVGASGLTGPEAQDALCTGIYYNFLYNEVDDG